MMHSAETDPAHDKIPLCSIHLWQDQVQPAKRALITLRSSYTMVLLGFAIVPGGISNTGGMGYL